MGQRLRLKAGFQIPTGWAKEEKAVLLGLKKYGAIVADNGNFFSISVTPDDRYPANAFAHLSSISITNFEVIQTTGPNEGPRAPKKSVAIERQGGVLHLNLQGGAPYVVERSVSLSTPNWTTIATVTNTSWAISTDGTTSFYRAR
jgi:hypothetical protein